ncbi:hypothetical protein DFR29_1061 [Tahibacter aquaticus]|uniref:Uncharacterized protein n=1 Tax=Tahibacter aquaticus TaxID=520092 RepID=A0A4R6YXY2_9GAMM|nr:hypothetical protein [Tahibacter aquaticus]TDR43859.1 hypothetical protein DFR29_1061 [Tahibacter aquaticus]
MPKNSPPTAPLPNRQLAQSFAKLLQKALSLELDVVLEALAKVAAQIKSAAALAQADLDEAPAPPAQAGIAGPAEWAQLQTSLQQCQQDWNNGSAATLDSGLLAKKLDTASIYLTSAGESHPHIAASVIGDAHEKIAKTQIYLASKFLTDKDNRAESVRAARTFLAALKNWIDVSSQNEVVDLAIELRSIDADWSKESRYSVDTVLRQLSLAVPLRESLHQLALAEIECENARKTVVIWRAQLETLLAVENRSATAASSTARAILDRQHERRSYRKKEFADLIQRLRKQFLQKAEIDADLMGPLSVDNTEEAARNLKNAAGSWRRANKELDQHAQRMSLAPLSSATSFQQWRDSRNEILGAIEKRFDQAAKTLSALRAVDNQLTQFLQLEATLRENESPIIKLIRIYKKSKSKHKKQRAYGQADGLSLCDILRDEMTRLEAAHAALPVMPADWSKPASHALMLFIAGALTYVLFGAVLLRQPLWNVFGVGDATDLVFHPAYIFGLALLVIWTSLAARDVPRKHADRALNRLKQARRGEPHVSAVKTPLMQFSKSIAIAQFCALAVVTAGVCVGWLIASRYGGMAYAEAPRVECRKNTRVYAFSRGFVAVGPSPLENYLVYTKDPAASLCGRKLRDREMEGTPKSTFKLPKALTDSLSALSELKWLNALGDMSVALKDGGLQLKDSSTALTDSAKALRDVATALGKIADTLSSPTTATTSLRISASVQELKQCQQNPDSPNCIFRPLTLAVAEMDKKIKVLSDGMPSVKEATKATETNTKILSGVNNNIEDMLAEWREAKARNFFTFLRDKAVGNKQKATSPTVPRHETESKP